MSKLDMPADKRTKKHSSELVVTEDESRIPDWMKRSSIYRRVPVVERNRLEEAILLRPDRCATLEAISDKYKLAERYRISLKTLRTYARRLEDYVRLAISSQVLSGLLGCLPARYRRKFVDGGQVLLLSRVMQSLSGNTTSGLPVADLAKLASIFSSFAAGANIDRGSTKSRVDKDKNEIARADTSVGDPGKIAESVRMLYGLDWPPKESD